MTIKINLNGVISEETQISVLDHGFLFGDSIYEVILTRNHHLYFLKEHLKRLRKSAEGISLAILKSDEEITQEIYRTLESVNHKNSYVRIVMTRGIGDIDIDPVSCEQPNILIYVKEAMEYPPSYYEKGINISLVSIKRNPKEALNPGIKTGNYLNNVLAKMEANRAGAADALMLNPMGYLTECTTSNFFFVHEGRVLTPSLSCGILSGITRQETIRLARENGVLVEEGEWPPEALEKSDEAFITGTIKKIMPVTALDGHAIGTGKPGPITRKLIRLYQDLLDSLS